VDPYEVLGVTPDATMGEIEARYRLLLREYHPDLHHHEGADAIAFAETTTRKLNSAMDQLRRGNTRGRPSGGWDASSWSSTGSERPNDAPRPREKPSWWPPGDDPDADFEGQPRRAGADFYGAETREWFGTPISHHPDEPVPCPFCGRPYQRLDDYEYHLEQVHSYRRVAPRPPKPKGPWILLIGKARYIPLWLLVPIAFANWGMFGFGWFTATLALVLLVVWTQTSRIFRDY
jgi:hypothetical protein